MHYVESGNKNNTLMLFVHGFPEFWFTWRYQMEEFSKDYYVIAIDQRGFGETDKPIGVSQYYIDNMVEDLRQLVAQLGENSISIH